MILTDGTKSSRGIVSRTTLGRIGGEKRDEMRVSGMITEQNTFPGEPGRGG